MNLLRRTLGERGYVEDDRFRPDAIRVSMWSLGDRVGCTIDAGRRTWLVDDLVRAIADEAIEAIAATVVIEVLRRGSDVRTADIMRISGGQIDTSDEQETASEIFHDWTDGEDFNPFATEAAISDALLELDELGVPITEQEHLGFARDPELAAAAEARARARAEAQAEADARARAARATPAPWKRLRHPDGRKWAVRVNGDGFDLEMTDTEGDVVARHRRHDNAPAEVAMLIVAQLREGFVDE